jgi:chromosome segregation ATPase
MGTLSAQLAESEREGRALEQQLASTLVERNELHDQIQAINAQVDLPIEVASMAILKLCFALICYSIIAMHD